MNEEIIKDYERDFRLFCSLAADSQIEADTWSGGDEAAICWSARNAYKLAASQMHYRLEQLAPYKYPFPGLPVRNIIISDYVDKIIKEKTEHEQKTQPLS